MMRSLGNTAFLVLALAVLSACGAPYEDQDFQKAIKGIDHVASSNGGCQTIDLSYQCDTTVEMSTEATADDVVEAIEATGKLLRDTGKDTSTITVNDNGPDDPRGAVLEFTKPLKGARDIAVAMEEFATDGSVKFVRFEQRSKGVGISLTTKDDELAPLARVGEKLLATSGASSILAITENSDYRIDARKGAWPENEVGVLAAVSQRYSVKKAHAKKGFLSIAGITNSQEEVSAFAKSQPDYGAIDFVDVTYDSTSDLSNALPADLPAVSAITNELRGQEGFRSVYAAKGRLNIKVKSTATITAMERVLTDKLASEYAGLDIGYEIEKSLSLERPAGQDLWLDTARSLEKSGLFAQLRIGRTEPDGTERAVNVQGKEGVGPVELARAVAEAWQPDQSARVQITYRSPEGQRHSPSFTAGETITIDQKSNNLAKEQADLIMQGWAAGRAK